MDYPLQTLLEALLGQWEAGQPRLQPWEEKQKYSEASLLFEVPKWGWIIILAWKTVLCRKYGIFSLKIGWDFAWALLVLAPLTALPPDFLNSGISGNNIGSPFRHFGYFVIFYSFGKGIYLAVWHFLIPTGIFHQQFYFPVTFFCNPGKSDDEIRCRPHSSGCLGLGFVRFLNPLLSAKRLIRAGHLQKYSDRD